MLVEPRVAELVGDTVASLRAAGMAAIPVTDPHGRSWAPAYVLGSLKNDGPSTGRMARMAVAEIVLDGSGRLVRNHPVQVIGSANKLLPVSCPSLAERYEQFIRTARVAEEVRGDAMVLTRNWDLMLAGHGSEPVALAEYLSTLCLSALGHSRRF